MFSNRTTSTKQFRTTRTNRYLAKNLVLNKIKDNLGGQLKCAFTGGAKLEFEVQQFFGDIGIPIIEGYGLTETSPIIVTEKYGPTEFTQGGLQEAPGVQVYICEQNSSKVLPMETEGEICVVGPNVMIGYHNRDEETSEVIFDLDGHRAFRTGDMGVLCQNRTLTITGRCKELYVVCVFRLIFLYSQLIIASLTGTN